MHLFLPLDQCKQLLKALVLTSLQISTLAPSCLLRDPRVDQNLERTCYTLCLFLLFFFATALSAHTFLFLKHFGIHHGPILVLPAGA